MRNPVEKTGETETKEKPSVMIGEHPDVGDRISAFAAELGGSTERLVELLDDYDLHIVGGPAPQAHTLGDGQCTHGCAHSAEEVAEYFARPEVKAAAERLRSMAALKFKTPGVVPVDPIVVQIDRKQLADAVIPDIRRALLRAQRQAPRS